MIHTQLTKDAFSSKNDVANHIYTHVELEMHMGHLLSKPHCYGHVLEMLINVKNLIERHLQR